MSGITFRYRKTHEHIDSSYYLMSGKEMGDASAWFTGDSISVCFDGQGDKIKAITADCPGRFDFNQHDDDFLSIPCEVVKRHRSIIWRDVGRFEELITCSVTLEATSGYWEDVLLWVILNQKPEWICE